MELRGDHAHKYNKQVLVCISGEIIAYRQKVDEEEVEDILLPGEWVYHSNLEWISLSFKDRNTTMLSINSMPYSKDDYLNTFEELEEYIKHKDSLKARPAKTVKM